MTKAGPLVGVGPRQPVPGLHLHHGQVAAGGVEVLEGDGADEPVAGRMHDLDRHVRVQRAEASQPAAEVRPVEVHPVGGAVGSPGPQWSPPWDAATPGQHRAGVAPDQCWQHRQLEGVGVPRAERLLGHPEAGGDHRQQVLDEMLGPVSVRLPGTPERPAPRTS